MKKSTVAIIAAFIILIGVVAWLLSRPTETTNTVSQSGTDSTANFPTADQQVDTAQDTPDMYTLEQVSEHNTRSDCWTVINGSVYDVTSFIARHPGEDNILSACGIDATSYFNGQQAGAQGGSNDHREDREALSELSNLKIGELQN